MKRRKMLKCIAGGATLAALNPTLAEEVYVDFDRDAYSELLESGKPFILGFLSDW